MMSTGVGIADAEARPDSTSPLLKTIGMFAVVLVPQAAVRCRRVQRSAARGVKQGTRSARRA